VEAPPAHCCTAALAGIAARSLVPEPGVENISRRPPSASRQSRRVQATGTGLTSGRFPSTALILRVGSGISEITGTPPSGGADTMVGDAQISAVGESRLRPHQWAV